MSLDLIYDRFIGDSIGFWIEQLLTPFRLRVARILDLDVVGRWLIGCPIGGCLPLRHDALQIEFADLIEEL